MIADPPVEGIFLRPVTGPSPPRHRSVKPVGSRRLRLPTPVRVVRPVEAPGRWPCIDQFRLGHEQRVVDGGRHLLVLVDPLLPLRVLGGLEQLQQRHLGEADLRRGRREVRGRPVAVDAGALRDPQLRPLKEQRVLVVVVAAPQRVRVHGRIGEARRGIRPRCLEREQVEEVVRRLVPVRQVLHPEQALDRGQHRRVVVDGVIDDATSRARRDDQSRHPHAQLVGPEVVLDVALGDRVAGRNGGGRRDVVVEPAVLVEGDEQHAPLPERRVSDRLVDVLGELLASRHVVRGCIELPQVKSPGPVTSNSAAPYFS